MDQQPLLYCQRCSREVLGSWKGWPHRDVVPALPQVIAGSCLACGETSSLQSSSIAWLNYHSPYSTGLPDHWLLVVVERPNKWGLPYFAAARCPKCSQPTVVSEMRYPDGTHELKHNCPQCGVLDVPE